MALVKDVFSEFGVSGNYWRIIAVETHYGGPNQLWPSSSAPPVTYIHLAQYVSKQARLDGAMSLQVQKIVLDGKDNGLPVDSAGYVCAPAYLAEPTRASAYVALKTMPLWSDAVDD